MRGANFLQSNRSEWQSPATDESLRRLRATGANWVALVPFLRQSDPAACDIALDQHYSLEGIASLVRRAKALGFKVALKPQMLVSGAWAGEIAPQDEAGWGCWFDAYTRALLPMARVAKVEGVDMLVVGTELKKTEGRPEWRLVLARLRGHYQGPLSWVFHAPDDVLRFAALPQLHLVGLSLYPKLGETPAETYRATQHKRMKLKAFSKTLPKPLWIAEVGIPSRAGAGLAPWLWQGTDAERAQPDPGFQAEALQAWLEALSGSWHRGVMVWNWMSDPHAGGLLDTDYTPQNKPAERVLRCAWAGVSECAQ